MASSAMDIDDSPPRTSLEDRKRGPTTPPPKERPAASAARARIAEIVAAEAVEMCSDLISPTPSPPPTRTAERKKRKKDLTALPVRMDAPSLASFFMHGKRTSREKATAGLEASQGTPSRQPLGLPLTLNADDVRASSPSIAKWTDLRRSASAVSPEQQLRLEDDNARPSSSVPPPSTEVVQYMEKHADTEVFRFSPAGVIHAPKPLSPRRHTVVSPSIAPGSRMAFREWSAGDFGGPREGASPSPWGSPSPGPGVEGYVAADKEWFAEALATSSAKVVESLADKIVDHDGMMQDEFNNIVSDLGDEMRTEMKEFKAELRALVVAKVSAQEKEIRELREMVLSLAKKLDGGHASTPPLPPPVRKARGESKGPQAPSYAQAGDGGPAKSPFGPAGTAAKAQA
jgi:hypothetical protein